MKAILTVGVSGSGKSTWAKRQWDGKQDYPVKIICRDDVRWAITGREGWATYRFTKANEKLVTERCQEKLFDAAFNEQDVIIADTNLNKNVRENLIKQLKHYGYEVEIKEFPISFPEALRRDKERGIFSVGEEVLKKQWEMWVKYHMEKLENDA